MKIFDKKVGVLTVKRDLYIRTTRDASNPDGDLVDLMCMTDPIYPVFTLKDVCKWLNIKPEKAKAMLKDAIRRGHYFRKGNKYSESWRALDLNRARAFKQRGWKRGM